MQIGNSKELTIRSITLAITHESKNTGMHSKNYDLILCQKVA